MRTADLVWFMPVHVNSRIISAINYGEVPRILQEESVVCDADRKLVDLALMRIRLSIVMGFRNDWFRPKADIAK